MEWAELTCLSFDPHGRAIAAVRHVQVVDRGDVWHVLIERDQEVIIEGRVLVVRGQPLKGDGLVRTRASDLVEETLR